MNKLFANFVFLTMVFVNSAHAGISSTTVANAGFDKLTTAQQAEIVKNVTDKVSENTKSDVVSAVTSSVTPENVDKWVTVGQNIGKMFGGAAKEVGVAVNEFVKTPVGQLTMALIIWNYMGNVLVHIIGAVIILIFGSSAIWFIQRRNFPLSVMYDPEKLDRLGRRVIVKKSRPAMEGGEAFGYMVAYVVVMGATLITLFTY